MIDLNKPKKYTPDKYDKFGGVVLIIIVSLALFVIPYVIINRGIDNTDDVVCKEKYLGDDSGGGVISFRFIRKSDNKELTYHMYESETNIVTFDRLSNKIKEGTNCQIITDGFDNVREVNIPVDD